MKYISSAILALFITISCNLSFAASPSSLEPDSWSDDPVKTVEKIEQTRSSGYDAITWVSIEMEKTVLKLYSALGEIMNPILYIMVALSLIDLTLGYLLNKPPHLNTLVSVFVTILLMQQLLGESSLFIGWIYKPIMKLMLELPSFVIKSITSDSVISQSQNALEDAFLRMDITIGAIFNLSEKIADTNGLVSGISAVIKSYILMAVYFALQVTFVCLFIIAIGAIHILLAMLPFVLPFFVHPKTKKFTYNILHHSATFLIVPIILAIMMSFTIGFLADITTTAINLRNVNISSFPDSFYWQAMLLGIVTIFFIVKATSFASMIIGTPDAGFGQIFGSLVSLSSGAFNYAQRGLFDTVNSMEAGFRGGNNVPTNFSENVASTVGKGGRILTNSTLSATKNIHEVIK